MATIRLIKRHISLAAPRVILMCGSSAAYILDEKKGINSLRGKWFDYTASADTIRALPIFHPTFLIDHPASKKMAWQDLLKLKAELSAHS